MKILNLFNAVVNYDLCFEIDIFYCKFLFCDFFVSFSVFFFECIDFVFVLLYNIGNMECGEVGMKKLFVCDFDGTLYKKNNERQFKATMDMVKRLKSKGHEFVVATGRPLHLLEPYFEDFENMYFISNDGAVLSKGFEFLFSRPLDKDLIKTKLCDYKGDFIAYGQCVTYAKYKEKSVGFKIDEFFRHHVMRIGCVGEIEEDIYKITFVGKEPKADFLDKCWNSYGVFEFVAKGVNKGESLKKLQKALCFTEENTIVIGDGENDICMFEYGAKSYAMVSASPRVKAKAGKTVENVMEILGGEI